MPSAESPSFCFSFDFAQRASCDDKRLALHSNLATYFLDCGFELRKAWTSSHTDLRSPGYITD